MPARKQQRPVRVKVNEYGEQRLEALGYPTRMEFELNDGSVVELVHPWLWDDDVQEAYDAGKTTIEMARAALGLEEHARFVAGGGKSIQIVLATEEMKQRRPKSEDSPDPKGK